MLPILAKASFIPPGHDAAGFAPARNYIIHLVVPDREVASSRVPHLHLSTIPAMRRRIIGPKETIYLHGTAFDCAGSCLIVAARQTTARLITSVVEKRCMSA
jgi:hypothetical protein